MDQGTKFCVSRLVHQMPSIRSVPAHCCPFCQCNFNYVSTMRPCFTEKCIIKSQVTLNPLINPSHTKILTMNGQNIQRDKITLFRSNSPYSKKITIRYQSPKKIDNNIHSNRNFNSDQYLNQYSSPISAGCQQEAARPKILDRQKNKQKLKKILVSFKSVKSASTDAFMQTPIKFIGSQQQQNRYGSTDETDSAKSLSRVSIDQRAFND